MRTDEPVGFRRKYPLLRPMPDGRRWKLEDEEFYYQPWARHGIETIHVFKGFIHNFASVPRFLWWWLPPTGRYGSAAIVHDYLCEQAQKYHNYIAPTHKVAAAIFRDAMQELGVSGFRRNAMYWAVIAFGPKWKDRQ